MPLPTPIGFRCHSRIRHGIQGFLRNGFSLTLTLYININLDDSSLAGQLIFSLVVVCWTDAHDSDTCDCRWEGNVDFRLGVWEILSTEWRAWSLGQVFGKVYRRDAPD